jgi:predicted dienelactone hydrolase
MVMQSRPWIIVALLSLACVFRTQVAHAQTRGVVEDTVTMGGRTVVVWQPAKSAVRAPVVIFSHGLGGCPTGSRFMTAGLAARGYYVFAPLHRDAGCLHRVTEPARPKHRLNDPNAWGDLTYADRNEDIRAIVAELSTPEWTHKIDLNQLAVAGHSLGGYTALALAGGWTVMRLPGVRAVLAFAPYTAPFLAHGTMGDVVLPVMVQGGALDPAITTPIVRAGGAYDELRGPKFLVEFARAKHLSWDNRPNAAHDAMLAYAAAFLDHFVRGIAEENVLTAKLPGVTTLRFSRDRVATASERSVSPVTARTASSP